MATKFSASIALLLILNLLLFNLITVCGSCGGCSSSHKPPSHGRKPHKSTPCPSPPTRPTPGPSPPTQEKCPRDALKLGVCVDLLGGLLNLTLGTPPKEPCCTLLQGLADLEAAVCLCTALTGSILGIRLNLPINLSLILNYCGKELPTGFQCF